MNGPMFIVSAVFATVAIAASPAAAAIVEVHLKDRTLTLEQYRPEPVIRSYFTVTMGCPFGLATGNEALLAAHFIEPHKGYEVVNPPTTDPGAYELVCTTRRPANTQSRSPISSMSVVPAATGGGAKSTLCVSQLRTRAGSLVATSTGRLLSIKACSSLC